MKRHELEVDKPYAHAPTADALRAGQVERVVYRGSEQRRRLRSIGPVERYLVFLDDKDQPFRLMSAARIICPWDEWLERKQKLEAEAEAQSLQRQEDYERAMRAIKRLGISYSLLKIEHGGGKAMVTLSMPLSELRLVAERVVDAEAAS